MKETARPLDVALETLEAVVRGGFTEVEVYLKRGRSRRLDHGGDDRESWLLREKGWAVRASNNSGSFFSCGSGELDPASSWPAAAGQPFALPSAQPVAFWKPPADLDAALLGEREGLTVFEAITAALSAELPGAKVVRAVLEDGASSADLVSSRAVRFGDLRQRLAALRLEAEVARPGGGLARTRLYLAEREAKRFVPRTIARRLADRLVAMSHGRKLPGARDLVLAPSLGADILAALAPALIGSEPRILRLLDDVGRIASPLVTLVDDGRLPGGLAEAAVDGEGMPTRAVTLVEAGVFRQPLISSGQTAPVGFAASGCVARPSWRDRPRVGPTHLYLKPNPALSPADLLADATGAAYLLAATGACFVDLEHDHLEVPVCGFDLAATGATPIAQVRMVGSISGLLRGIQVVARDLQMQPGRGFFGAPTMLVRGLELV